MSIAIERSHTGKSRNKRGRARGENRKAARHEAATKRKGVRMLLARQVPMKSQAAADRQATRNHPAGAGPEGTANPKKGALAANRDAPCALSAAG